MGFLEVHFAMEGYKKTTTSPVKNLLKFWKKLEIWNLITHVYVVSECIPFSTKTQLILLTSAFVFWQKIRGFFGKNSTFNRTISMRAVPEIF